MAAKIYYQEDCNLSLLEGKTIAIIGYGSQGHDHGQKQKRRDLKYIQRQKRQKKQILL